MKILQFENRLQRGGGAEKFLLDLIIAEHQNNEVEVSLLNLVAPSTDEFSNHIKSVGIKVDNLSTSLYSPLNFIKLWKYIRDNDFDVVHVHLFPSLYFAVACKFCQKKKPVLVYTEHSTNNRRRGKKIFQIFDRFFYKRYDCIFAISEKVKESLENHVIGLPITVINNGIDISVIKQTPSVNIREELGLSDSTVLLTMVSRFAWMKDYKTVFQSMKNLPDNIHFLCVGDGEGLEEHRRIVGNEGLNNRIHFLGLRSDVIGVMKGSDIIILSSKYEGFSISMLEAMACGKPFVASDVPGLNDNAAGVADFFEYQNADLLASVVKSLISDRTHYDNVAQRCYQFAERYDINYIAQKYIDEYKKLRK